MLLTADHTPFEGFAQLPNMGRSDGLRNFRFSIDRGGTFTDVFAEYEDEQGQQHQRVLKLLSVDPANYPDAPREGIRRVLEACTGVPHPRGSPLDTSRVAAIRMGTTVRCAAVWPTQLQTARRGCLLPDVICKLCWQGYGVSKGNCQSL